MDIVARDDLNYDAETNTVIPRLSPTRNPARTSANPPAGSPEASANRRVLADLLYFDGADSLPWLRAEPMPRAWGRKVLASSL